MDSPTPEQLARIRAVNKDSPALERAGAAYLGAYLPQTGNEARLLWELISSVMRERPSDNWWSGLDRMLHG